MATERIVIQFRADGTRVVQANIKGVGSAAKKASKETDTLKRALKTLIGLEVARRIILLADSFTLLQNRIRVLTDSQKGLVRTTQALFDVANKTRTSVQSNALIFQRLTLATKGLVSGESEVLQIVETLNKALRISGTTTQEAAAGTIQLAQGFAAGALRGDELRSVMEQLPIIAQILEKELGVTRGELRDLGKEGKITSAILVSAFKNAREEIDEKFGKVIITIGEQFVILQNETIRMIGAFNEATGVFQTLADVVGFLANNLKTIIRVIGTVLVASLAAFASSLFAAAAASEFFTVSVAKGIVAVKAFGAAVLSTTFIVTAGLAAVILYRKEIDELIQSLIPSIRNLKIQNEAAATSNRLWKERKDALEAANGENKKQLKIIADVNKEIDLQNQLFTKDIEQQAVFAKVQKVLNDLAEKGLKLQSESATKIAADLTASLQKLRLNREENDVLKKLRGSQIAINRERAAARRLFAEEKITKKELLEVERQRFKSGDDLIAQLKTETTLLRQSSSAAEQDVLLDEAKLTLIRAGVKEGSILLDLKLKEIKLAADENREAAIRRQNLRDFNIDTSLQSEVLIVLGKQLSENNRNLKFRAAIIKELTIEQANLLVQMNKLSGSEFDQVIEKTLQPLRDQNELLRAEADAIGKTNVERDISISRIAIENSLKAKGVDINKENVRTLLDEQAALKRLIDLKQRQKSLEREFGIDQTANQERAAGLNELLAAGNANFDQRVAIMANLNEVTAQSTDFLAGLKQGFLDIDTSVLKLGMDIGGFLIGTINGAADALAEFAVGGFQDTKKLQQALSDLFRQLAKDIIAATIRMIIFRTIQAALTPGGGVAPGGGGGIDTGVTNVSGGLSQSAGGNLTFIPAQAGAFLQAGQPAIVGERGPEPFVPTASGRVLPNAAMAEAPAPQVTIVNVTDPKEVQAFLSTTEGEDVIMNVIQKRNRQVRGLIK